MNKYLYPFAIIALFFFASCESCSNKVGNKVGETLGEFGEGVEKGAKEAFDIKVETSSTLAAQGISVGKVLLSNDSIGEDNKLSIYLIFAKPFNHDVFVKVTDAKGLEIGRSKVKVVGEAGKAGYTDFVFDKRTNIDSDSKVSIE